jgi:predicted transposase/invertase (TIGR01784 family)
MRFLRATEREEFEMIARLDTAIAEAWKELKVLSLDKEARALAELIEKNEMDCRSEYFAAYKEGIEKGREEGRKETALKIATASIKINLPLEDIAEITDLSLDEVKQLAASLKD